MRTNRDQWQVPALLAIGLALGIGLAFLAGNTVWPPWLPAVAKALSGGAWPRSDQPKHAPPRKTRPPDVDTPREPTDHKSDPSPTPGATEKPVDEALTPVDRALEWLISHQRADGSWSFDLTRCQACAGACNGSGDYPDDYGATALAILPFLGRGFTHEEGPYRKQLDKAITLLVRRVAEEGPDKPLGRIYSFPGHGMYVQGFATRALAECYALSRDETLREPTQRAVRFIEAARNAQGGWRYTPKENQADVVSTGCQVLALHFAKQAGLHVSEPGLRVVGGFLDTATIDGGARYAYIGGNQQSRDGPTAVALLSRICLGWNHEHPALQRGIKELATNSRTRDLYFDYHATQIMHHRGGDWWIAWFPKLKALLHTRQARKGHAAGSWYEGFEHGESSQAGGRLFCTVMAALILETPFNPVVPRQVVVEEFIE